MKIAHITPKADFTLLIESEEGQSGLFDVRPYLELEAFRPLQDADEFFKVQNGRYFIEWNCDADLSSDTIFAKSLCSARGAQPVVPGDTPQAAHP